MAAVAQPMDLLKNALGKEVEVVLRGDRELRGTLTGVDQHINMMLAGVHETSREPGTSKVVKRDLEMLYVRGDGVVLVSPC